MAKSKRVCWHLRDYCWHRTTVPSVCNTLEQAALDNAWNPSGFQELHENALYATNHHAARVGTGEDFIVFAWFPEGVDPNDEG